MMDACSITGFNGRMEFAVSREPGGPVVLFIDASLNSFAGSGELVVLDSDWHLFKEHLAKMHSDLSGQAQLTDLAGAGHLNFEMRKGALTVRVKLTSSDGKQQLTGLLMSDQTYLAHLIRALG